MRRCRLEDIRAVAAALGEQLAIQSQTYRPQPGDANLIFCKNSTDTRWFRALTSRATALCLPRGRVVYPLQGAVLVYYGPRVEEFKRLCEPIGVTCTPFADGRGGRRC
jgi:hypothetical protein